MRSSGQNRSRYWRLLLLVPAIVCAIVSLFVPAHIGNWLVVAAIAMAVAFFGPAIRSRGNSRFFLGRR